MKSGPVTVRHVEPTKRPPHHGPTRRIGDPMTFPSEAARMEYYRSQAEQSAAFEGFKWHLDQASKRKRKHR